MWPCWLGVEKRKDKPNRVVIVRNAGALAGGKEKKGVWDFEDVAYTAEQGYAAWCSHLLYQGSNGGRVFTRMQENKYMGIKLKQLCFLSCVSKMANIMSYSQNIV